MQVDFDLGDLSHIEQDFYNAGYTGGFDHGRIHGLIEGRALGTEKGYEIWEEVGYYKGFALFWQALSTHSARSSRASHHAQQLLDLIVKFPTINPTPTETAADVPIDLPGMLTQIRSRYKALCASLGVKPRLTPAATSGEQQPQTNNLRPSPPLDDQPYSTPNQSKNTIWDVRPPHQQSTSDSKIKSFDF